MKINHKTVYYLVSYGSVLGAILVIVVSFRFRHEDPSEFIAQIAAQVEHFQEVQMREEEPDSEEEYAEETPYQTITRDISIAYEGLDERNPFEVLIEPPEPEEPEPEPVPEFDITYTTRNWRIMGPMRGNPDLGREDKMLIETERDAEEPLQVKEEDTVEAESRERGTVEIEIREINIDEYSMKVGYYDEELESDHTRTISMFDY